MELIDARHPLLEQNLRSSGGEVVPVSFALDDEKNAMVISGANAGGKTVVLKTTGLLALAALSGISVPAESARVPFYASVLADIGDSSIARGEPVDVYIARGQHLACSNCAKHPRWCCSMKSAGNGSGRRFGARRCRGGPLPPRVRRA